MKISIDCRMIHASGIGAYLRGILDYLLDSPHEFLLFGSLEALRGLAGGHKNVTVIPYAAKPFSLREWLFLPRAIRRLINGGDLYFSPYFNLPGGIRVPVYITIHDLIFFDMKELTSTIGGILRRWYIRRSYRYHHTKKVFTVSNFSKSRIEHFLGTGIPVVVAHSACPAYLAESEFPHREKNSNIIFIGNIKKHKGLGCLLDAFFEARKAGLESKLMVVGSQDDLRTADTELFEKTKNVIPSNIDPSNIDSLALEFTGPVPPERLKELLAQSALLVQPSLYEGFGMPPLEAMTMGTRALVSDIPVFREIYAGFPVVFFKAGDAADLKEKLLSLLYNREPETVVLTAEQKDQYSFKKTAAIILEAFQVT
jgi:glycosyltransferase involved in cell wall biosynthesis